MEETGLQKSNRKEEGKMKEKKAKKKAKKMEKSKNKQKINVKVGIKSITFKESLFSLLLTFKVTIPIYYLKQV